MSRPPRRPLRRVLALALIGAALAWWGWHASAPARPPPPLLPAPGEVAIARPDPIGGDVALEGRVVGPGGTPLRDVLVAIVSGGRIQSATTAEDGGFRIEGLVAGPHRVAAVALDRPPAEFPVELPAPAVFAIELGAAYTHIPALEAVQRRVLKGRVLLPFPADSADGFEVVFTPMWPAGELPPLDGRTERRARVDGEGQFAIPALALGSYEVLLLPPFAAGSRWPTLARLTYDHRADTSTEPFVLASQHGAIEGQIVDTLGGAIEGALIELVDSSAPARVFPHLLSGADGTFRVPQVPAGTWRLSISAGEARVERLIRVAALRLERLDLPPLDVRL